MEEGGTLHERSNVPTILFIGIAIIITAIALYLGRGYIMNIISNYTEDPAPAEEITEIDSDEEFGNLEGYVYFVDDDSENRRGVPFVYDLAEDRVYPVPHDESWYVRNITPTLEGVAFQRAPFDPESIYWYPYSEYVELVHTDRAGKNPTILDTRDVGEPEGLTWSEEASMYAYYGLSAEATAAPWDINYVLIKNWDIYLINSDGTDSVVIEDAVRPVWSPDGQYVYYVKTTGLYRYVIASGETEEVFVVEGLDLPSGAGLGMTGDGAKLILSSPLGKDIFVYSLTEDGSQVIDIEIHKSLNDQMPFTVTASPNGMYALYVTYERREEGVDESVLVGLNLENGTQRVIFSIPIEMNHRMTPVWSDIAQ